MGYFEKSIEALNASDELHTAGERGADATFLLLRAIALALQAIAAETAALAAAVGDLQTSQERQRRR